MPVFVSRRVLDEAAERTHAEEGSETGGILIGKLWRDADAGEIFAEVTAQIPAEHTSGSNVKLTFTPANLGRGRCCFAAAQAWRNLSGLLAFASGARVVQGQGLHARGAKDLPPGQGLFFR